MFPQRMLKQKSLFLQKSVRMKSSACVKEFVQEQFVWKEKCIWEPF